MPQVTASPPPRALDAARRAHERARRPMAGRSLRCLVLNTTRRPSAAYLMLHRANCWTITRLHPQATTFTSDYSKLRGGRDELEACARKGSAGARKHAGTASDRHEIQAAHDDLRQKRKFTPGRR
jgi:hypothetical protein